MTRTPGRATARRRAAVAAFAVAAGTLAMPFGAQHASATTGTTSERQVLLVSTSTGNSIVSRAVGASDAAGDKTLVPEVRNHFYTDLSSSADGSRFAYVSSTYASATSLVPSQEQVAVRDIGGHFLRVVESTTTADVYSPALSPDGTKVVWSRDDGSVVLRLAPVVSGTAIDIPGSRNVALDAPTFLNDLTLVFTDVSNKARTLPVKGGTSTLLAGVSTGGPLQFDVSRDGTKLAWALDTTPANSGTYTYDVYVADLSGSPTAPTVSGALLFATGLDNEDPSFSTDGLSLSFVKYDGKGGPGDVLTGRVDKSSAPMASPATTQDEVQVDGATVDTDAPPSPATLTGLMLAGTAASVRWTLPTDAPDISGVCVRRALGATAPVATSTCSATGTGNRAFFAPGTTGADSGLTVGQTYTYVVQPVDRSGNLGPVSGAKSLVATAAPTFTVADPTSNTRASTPFTVGYSTVDKAGTVYTVDYREVASSTFRHYTTTTSRSNLFGAGNAPVAVRPGQVYEFRGTAKDAFGNSTALFTNTTHAVVPFDQTRAAFTSTATTVTGSYRWLGNSRVLSKPGQLATFTNLNGNRLQIIGDKATTGGSFIVYLKNGNGTYTKLGNTASTYSTSGGPRRVLYSYTFTTSATRSYQLRWTHSSASSHKNVVIDALAIRR